METTSAVEYECSVCSMKLKTKHGLARHKFRHTGEKPHICSTCGARFALREYLINHMRGHSDERHFICQICGKPFARKTTLNAHLVTHSEDKQFSCAKCEKQFTTKANRDYHQRAHCERRTHPCGMCDKIFTTASYLKCHMNAHLGIQQHRCEECGREFSNKTIYQEHLLRHKGDKQFQCSICPQSYFNLRDLKTHEEFHKNRTRFQCHNCQMFFQSDRSLQNHTSKLHTTVLCCEFCGEQFVNKRFMKKHMLKFHRDQGSKRDKMPKEMLASFKKELCDLCGKVFSNKYRLRAHLTVKHSLNKQEIKEKELLVKRNSAYVACVKLNRVKSAVRDDGIDTDAGCANPGEINVDNVLDNIKIYRDEKKNENLVVLEAIVVSSSDVAVDASAKDSSDACNDLDVSTGEEPVAMKTSTLQISTVPVVTTEAGPKETPDIHLTVTNAMAVESHEASFDDISKTTDIQSIVEHSKIQDNIEEIIENNQEHIFVIVNENEDPDTILNSHSQGEIYCDGSRDTQHTRYITEHGDQVIIVADEESICPATTTPENITSFTNSNNNDSDVSLANQLLDTGCKSNVVHSTSMSVDEAYPAADTTEDFEKFENALRVTMDSLKDYQGYEAFLNRMIMQLQYSKYKHWLRRGYKL